jgi:uncharacterized protein (TIGR03790 family)
MSSCRSCLLSILLCATAARAERPLAETTIIIYNKTAPDSVDLAKFYMQQRGIARDHLVPLSCSTAEEIDRAEYDSTIAEPLRKVFHERGWWRTHRRADGTESIDSSAILIAAVMKGVPLKIRPVTAPYEGDQVGNGPVRDQNAASVDSELSILASSSRQISGVVTNPYFKSFRAIREFEGPILLLACRLDAPTAAVVKRMITDGIAAEKNGLWGNAYVDGSHNSAPGAAQGDGWMNNVTTDLRKAGVPVVFDDLPGVFPAGYPMTNCAFYYGWYAGQAAGPFNDPGFRFVPGAVAAHIHSFSAATLHDANANWVAPLLMHGAAASVGNVYEPYLQLSSQLDLLNDRLLHGFTFAESAYLSLPALSWMNVAVGDPLYRPFASWLNVDQPRETSRAQADWKFYHEFAVKNANRPTAEYRALARQAATRARNAVMLEDLGGMEARDGNFTAATSLFQQARATYTSRDDIIRVVIEECDALVKSDKRRRALDLVRSTLRIVSASPAAPILQEIERQLKNAAP